MSFKISWKIHLLCFLISLIISCLLKDLINDLFMTVIIENKFICFTGSLLLDFIIFVVTAFVPIAFVHELIHGNAYRLFGGNVRYGFKGLYAYAQEISGIVLHRTQFLIVLLAPVTIISVVSLFFPKSIGKIMFILNFFGSTGDLLMSLYLCKTNENSYILDKNYGFDVIDKNE